MKEKNSSALGALTLIVSDAAIADAIALFFASGHGNHTLKLAVFQWIPFSALIFLLYRLFLRRERKLVHAVAFLAVSYAVMAAALLIFFTGPSSPISTAITIIIWSMPIWRIYRLSETPPELSRLISRFGAVVIVFLIVLIIIFGAGGEQARTAPHVLSLFLCFVSLIVMRTAHSDTDVARGMRGVAVLLAFALVIGSCIAVFYLFISASLGDAVAAGAGALLRGLNHVFRLIMRFLLWLVSLLPEPGGESGFAGEAPPSIPDGVGDYDYLPDPDPGTILVVICVIAALVVAAVITLVIIFRGKRLGGKGGKKTGRPRRGGTRPDYAFLRLLLEKIRFFADSIIYRNTPQGVFLRLERWGRRRRRGRRAGETQRSYIMRVSDDVPGQRQRLLKLANALDACWYGDPSFSQLPRSELSAIRRSFLF